MINKYNFYNMMVSLFTNNEFNRKLASDLYLYFKKSNPGYLNEFVGLVKEKQNNNKRFTQEDQTND